MHASCNQLKSAIDSVRIRRRLGDSTDCCFRDFYGVCWQETCGSKVCSVPPLTRAEGISYWSYTGHAWTSNKNPDFPKKVITRDESWVCDPETKSQSSQWKSSESPCPKKARQSWSNVKAMLMVFLIMKVFSTKSTLLAASSWQSAYPFFSSLAGFFGKTSHHPGLSAPLQPRFGPLWLLAFPKAKITIEREEICESDGHTIQKLAERGLTADWLPNYIKAMRPVIKIFKMAGYFQDRPHIFSFFLCTVHWLWIN